MKTAQEWNWEHTNICANDPAVHGQLLPTPQMVNFLKRVQADALQHAAKEVRESSNFPEDRGALSKAAMILEGIAETVTSPDC